MRKPTLFTFFQLFLVLILLPGCSAMPKSGPSRSDVTRIGTSPTPPGIAFVNVDNSVAQKLLRGKQHALFSEVFGGGSAPGYQVERGDILEISVWEAPPSMLFGGASSESRKPTTATQAETLPQQMVREDGRITIPFAGRVRVAGRTVHQIEDAILEKFQGKANQPQVMVRVIHSPASNVTIIGDVASSALMPITPKGERLLEALAVAGGAT
ncbi:polysaccharide export protein, partial [Desulfovibrio sp. OttesenSCG-928-G11]|nr:polysaccharide export protein [Desulfovibrio sp. OttesenSCG-928-G11]